MRMTIQDREEARFAMAPMIDMVFLLLVFFMCASHLSHRRTLPLDMPTASSGVVPEDRPDRWIVNITEDGAIHSGTTPIEADALRALVAERRARDPNLKVYLRADADCEHRQVKRVMKSMAEAGIDQFIFGVYTPSGGE